MSNTHSAGGVIKNSNDAIALVQHDGWFWGFPKGHVDVGENFITAARREIQEEVGISALELRKEFEPYVRLRGGDEEKQEVEREKKTIHMFFFDTTQEEFTLTDPRHDEARWVPVEEVAELLSHPQDKEFFLNIKDSLK